MIFNNGTIFMYFRSAIFTFFTLTTVLPESCYRFYFSTQQDRSRVLKKRDFFFFFGGGGGGGFVWYALFVFLCLGYVISITVIDQSMKL